jgi:hypothetical protein
MKRFTETLKWSKPWFRQLQPKHKLLWQWMCDTCDNAGILDADWGLASFQIGCAFTAADLEAFDGRATIIPCGKVWIPSFITFQCSTLSRDCKAHGPIFTSLEKHGINPETLTPIGYAESPNRVFYTHKEKEKEKEPEMDKDKDKEKEKAKDKFSAAKASSPDEVREYAKAMGFPETAAVDFWDKMQAGGWKRGKESVKDWQAHFRTLWRNGWLASGETAPAGKPVQISFALQDKERKEAERHGPEVIVPKIYYQHNPQS